SGDAVPATRPGTPLAPRASVGTAPPDALLGGLPRPFQTTGGPGGLPLVFAAGQGDGQTRGLNRLALPGLVRRAVGGHWGLIPRLGAMALRGELEAYNLPQGCISHLYRDIAAGKPGTLSKVGLATFDDPRLDGAQD